MHLDSAVTQLAASEDEADPAMARVRIEPPSGGAVESAVRVRWDDTPVTVGGKVAQVAIAPKRIPLPYRVELDDFQLLTYPGSDNPASFESHVRLFDESRGINGEPFRIYMNHPLTYRGFKHFQSSYDRDHRGTVLSVNHDPGKWPTYIGYMLITLGFVITLTRGKLWMREPRLPHGGAH
ncbi:MAG: cytochrome c biogenesis protein ResB [Candidatus Eisenbacteria bacterium]